MLKSPQWVNSTNGLFCLVFDCYLESIKPAIVLSMIRILLVDDHEIFRDGMKALINDIEGYSVVAEAGNGHEALKCLELLDIDLVLSDLHMPEMDGLKLTRTVRERYPKIKIVVLTMDAERAYIETVREIGAHGYITKSTNLVKLQSVLSSVFESDSLFELAITAGEIRKSEEKNTSVLSQLTKRELEILSLIAKGLTDKEIAEQIFLSPYTVITHRKNLLSKLGLSNKVELTRFALENNIDKTGLLK